MANILKGIDTPVVKHKAKEIIFTEGGKDSCFFIIRSGTVGVYKNHGKQNQLEIAKLEPGHVLGEISGIDGMPHTATAIAETDVEVLKIGSDAVKYQIEQCPSWFRSIVLDLVQRLRKSVEGLSPDAHPPATLVSSMKVSGSTP